MPLEGLWHEPVSGHLCAKWDAGRADSADWLEIVRLADGAAARAEADAAAPLPFSSAAVLLAATTARSAGKIDGDGVCMRAVAAALLGAGPPVARALLAYASDWSWARSLRAPGVALGKLAARSDVGDLRCIVPVPCVAAVADRLVAGALHAWLDARLPPRPGVTVATRRGLQLADVVHGALAALEAGRDRRGQAAVAQQEEA